MHRLTFLDNYLFKYLKKKHCWFLHTSVSSTTRCTHKTELWTVRERSSGGGNFTPRRHRAKSVYSVHKIRLPLQTVIHPSSAGSVLFGLNKAKRIEYLNEIKFSQFWVGNNEEFYVILNCVTTIIETKKKFLLTLN